MGDRIALLVNPTAGKGRGRSYADVAEQRLRAGGADVVRVQGRDAADAVILAAATVAAGVDALVACGGDGLVHLAVQVVAGTGTPLGLVPAGTGDDLARVLGVPRRDPGAAADVVLRGRQRRVDLGWARGEDGTANWFHGVVATGFDSRVNDRANRMRRPRGRARYPLAMLVELGVFTPLAYRLVLDGEPWQTEAMLVAVGNGPSYGGGMKVVPDARMDDGLLDVMVVGRLGRAELLRVFPRVYAGSHVRHAAVTVRRAATVRLESPGTIAYADGEVLGPLPQTYEAVPGALVVRVP